MFTNNVIAYVRGDEIVLFPFDDYGIPFRKACECSCLARIGVEIS